MAFDVARQETVLFGGRQNSWNSTQAFGDTWVFDGTDWAMATPLNSPPARLNAALAYHPALGGVMLHGGEDPQSGALGDSWWFDGCRSRCSSSRRTTACAGSAGRRRGARPSAEPECPSSTPLPIGLVAMSTRAMP